MVFFSKFDFFPKRTFHVETPRPHVFPWPSGLVTFSPQHHFPAILRKFWRFCSSVFQPICYRGVFFFPFTYLPFDWKFKGNFLLPKLAMKETWHPLTFSFFPLNVGFRALSKFEDPPSFPLLLFPFFFFDGGYYPPHTSLHPYPLPPPFLLFLRRRGGGVLFFFFPLYSFPSLSSS